MDRLCFHTTLALLLAIILAGCEESGKPKTLGEKEIYFDDKLASVSPDGDSACWIGSETGDIWYFSENERRTYNIGTDRIYKVVPDRTQENHSEFWLGIRNSGLQKWTVKDGNPVMLACYHIANKNDKYSVYDILTDGDMVYAATSQGLYSMKRDDAEPALIYPEPSSETARKGKPMMVSSLCLNGNELLACSQDGLIKFNTSTHSVTVLHAAMPIHSVETCDGHLRSHIH
ncbi:MAG: hypothetical protein K2L56_03745, partial [Prevotella sp.]|nr:hypothetical protein [Prevotella sp.]